MNYIVGEYPREGSGEWGVFCNTSDSWILFGPKEEMETRCKELNDEGEEIHHVVTWEIDIWASSPEKAARKALAIQRDPESTAVVFNVKNMDTQKEVEIDLDES